MSLFMDGFSIGFGVGLGVAITVGPAWFFAVWVDHEIARRRALWGRRR